MYTGGVLPDLFYSDEKRWLRDLKVFVDMSRGMSDGLLLCSESVSTPAESRQRGCGMTCFGRFG